ILIATDINQTDLITHSQSIIINSNTINDNGFLGGRVSALISGNNPDNGVYIVNRATGTGSFLSQNLAILDNVISHNAEQGIRIHNDAREDGDISQFVIIDPNTIDHNGANGILVSNFVSGFGSVIDQTLGVGFNFISANGSDGIFVDTFADIGGVVHQRTVVYGNSIYHNSGDGVALTNNAFSGLILQTAFLDFNRIDDNHDA